MMNMKIVICSAYLNHHNKPIYDELSKKVDLSFISTKHMRQERVDLGYTSYDDCQYNIYASSLNEEIKNKIDNCDIFIYGTAPIAFLQYAENNNKIVLIQLERLFKQTFLKIFNPKIAIKYYLKYIKYKKNKKTFFLCQSYYAPKDLIFLGIPKVKIKRWAYISNSYIKKDKNKNDVINLLWVGRFIWWKNPIDALKICKKLKKNNINFNMNIIGSGKLENKIKKYLLKYKIDNCVNLLGSKSPLEVGDYMDLSDILLATSNRMEGWGVVINEAMQHKCCVIANKKMGCVPELIINNVNGYYYKKINLNKVIKICNILNNDRSLLNKIQEEAYNFMSTYYSIDNAIDSYMTIFDSLISNEEWPNIKDKLGRKV